VLTLDGPLSADGMARLNALWAQIAEYGRNLQNVPLSEIQGRLNAFKEQIKEIVRGDPGATRDTGSSTTATTSPSPPGPSQAPSPGVTVPPAVPFETTTTAPATGGVASENPERETPATTEPATPPTP